MDSESAAYVMSAEKNLEFLSSRLIFPSLQFVLVANQAVRKTAQFLLLTLLKSNNRLVISFLSCISKHVIWRVCINVCLYLSHLSNSVFMCHFSHILQFESLCYTCHFFLYCHVSTVCHSLCHILCHTVCHIGWNIVWNIINEADKSIYLTLGSFFRNQFNIKFRQIHKM